MISTPDKSDADIGEALAVRPRILLIGQRYARSGEGHDVLRVAYEAGGIAGGDAYAACLTAGAGIGVLCRKIADVDRAVAVPEPIEAMLRLPWQAVITSAVDSVLRRALDVPDARQVRQVVAPATFDIGASPALPLLRLFGTTERTEAGEHPPESADQLRRRRPEAKAALTRLREWVTPRGHLFVDGWNPRSDWFRPRDLGDAIASLMVGQVHIFGMDSPSAAALAGDEDCGPFVESGAIALHEAPLATVVDRLIVSGHLLPQVLTREQASGVSFQVVTAAQGSALPEVKRAPETLTTIAVPQIEWQRLSQALTILLWIDPTEPLPLLSEQRYAIFRTFISTPVSTSDWRLLRHLAFRRPVSRELLDRCRAIAQDRTPQDRTVVLYGQSGSGKSVVLQLLALDLRLLGLPVAYVGPERSRGVPVEILNELANIIETESSAPLFIVIDSTTEDSEYVRIANQLTSLGRKCVVVGSSLPGQKLNRKRPNRGGKVDPVRLPVEMAPAELQQFLAHVAMFLDVPVESLERLLDTPRADSLGNFFAALYRLLPDVRRRLETSLISEVHLAVERLHTELMEAPPSLGSVAAPFNALELALRQALTVRAPVPTISENGAEQIAARERDARELFNAIMLASRHSLFLPQSLGLRLIQHDFAAYLLPDDVVVEIEDRGSIFLSARQPLEAHIWVRDQLGDEKSQLALIRRVVLHLDPYEALQDRSAELDFVVKLLQAVGPQGPEGSRLSRSYWDLAAILVELRERIGAVHPRLALVESNAIREAVKTDQYALKQQSKADRAARMTVHDEWLDRAEKGLARASEAVRNASEGRPLSTGARRMLATLTTERACHAGVRIGNVRRLIDAPDAASDNWQRSVNANFTSARTAWRAALDLDEQNLPAIDAACWISSERLTLGGVGPTEESEILADWSDLLDRYQDTELSPSQLDKFDMREAEFADRIGDIARFDAIASRAGMRGSAAPHTLRARQIAAAGGTVAARAAREYLERVCPEFLSTDRAVLLLYFRLWWTTETGLEGFFATERAALAFSRGQWTRLRDLADARRRLDGEANCAVATFLGAVARTHLGEVHAAIHDFQGLDRMNVGGFRRARSLILFTDDAGRARRLVGEYRGRNRGPSPLLWCDELRAELPFNPGELDLPNLRSGDSVGPFILTFNYRGLYAESPRRLGTSGA